jgi:dihydrofolate synthase / folylpolyglutamate synthase
VTLGSYRAALEWLESHVDFERVAPNRLPEPTLEPIRETLAAIGSPHHDYPAIHITGTNGKGTTTTITSRLLRETGLRVGTFVSPDLHEINERIAVNSEPIRDSEFVRLMSRLRDIETTTGISLTRFEILTVGALLHFSDEGVDVAVIEVGMGGTWDSTNVIDGDVSVITNVSLDHAQVLGPTVSAIARDKVGILRSTGIGITASQDPEVAEIIRDRAAALGCQLWVIGEDFHLSQNELAVGGRLLSYTTPFSRGEDVFLSLHGIHQGMNAVTAIAATEAFLGSGLDEAVVRETLGQMRMPGRMEVVGRNPMIVVDGAHNPAGIQALCATLDGAFDVQGTRRCIVGMLTGREVEDMVAPLIRVGFAEFHVAAPQSPRAQSTTVVADAVRRLGGVVFEHPHVAAALAHAKERSTDDDLIVACGSLYLVAEVRSSLLGVASRHLTDIS